MNYDLFGLGFKYGLHMWSHIIRLCDRKRSYNKSFLEDNSQPLTFLTMKSPTTTVTLRPFSFLFLCLAFMFLLIFFYVIISEIYSPWWYVCSEIIRYFIIISIVSLCIIFIWVTENFISVLSYIYFILLSFIAIFTWVSFGSSKLIFWALFL